VKPLNQIVATAPILKFLILKSSLDNDPNFSYFESVDLKQLTT
jgi:hypothetical protein